MHCCLRWVQLGIYISGVTMPVLSVLQIPSVRWHYPLYHWQNQAFLMTNKNSYILKKLNICLLQVSTADQCRSSPKTLISCNKKSLYLPPEMSAIHIEFTEYYYPDGKDYPSKVFVLKNKSLALFSLLRSLMVAWDLMEILIQVWHSKMVKSFLHWINCEITFVNIILHHFTDVCS